MPIIRITEKQDAYITAEVEVTNEVLHALRKARDNGDTQAINAWNTQVQSEGDDLDWTANGCGEVFETVLIDVEDDATGLVYETIWER
jgi:hypothetical protein